MVQFIIAIALILGLLPLSVRGQPAGHRAQTNIVIVFGDDIGYADFNCFGHPTSRTPQIDRLARNGSKLVQYLSAANICSPSRGSLLTGRKFARLGIFPGVFSPLSISGLGLNETTMAEALRGVGYATMGLGKWHLGTKQPVKFLQNTFARTSGPDPHSRQCFCIVMAQVSPDESRLRLLLRGSYDPKRMRE